MFGVIMLVEGPLTAKLQLMLKIYLGTTVVVECQINRITATVCNEHLILQPLKWFLQRWGSRSATIRSQIPSSQQHLVNQDGNKVTIKWQYAAVSLL